ncbi:RNA polymerase sigma factor [Sphingomonas sp. 2R-10]|uniref:RNA polymerase sigma factor n=1 Tax=Sphingomonas sp. 2R-10 TaxID=3045148 RepID=UPI0013DE672A|nr:RNA polymerase sigma factor [Sphingomonas sp. 2R-10]
MRTHRLLIVRFFNRHAQDKADVPDLVQDALLKLIRTNLPEKIDNPDSYVISVARSVLVDHHRRRQARHAGDHASLDEVDVSSTDFGADRVLDSRAMAERIQAALLELPERTRDVFALRTLREMRMAEVARTMRISLSTAEKHHARALAHLVQRLMDFRE